MIPILVAITGLLAQPAAAHSAAKTGAKVEGRVVDSLRGEAVRKATVILRAHDPDQGISFADETGGDGRFSIDDVEPGEYAIFAERPGYSFQSNGATGAPPPSVKVEKDQVKDVVIRLTPLGVIAGRVLDADGDPVRDATVSALRRQYVAGKKQLRIVEQVQSNDSGDFRLFGLRAGTFYLRANRFRRGTVTPESGFTYYPGTSDESHAGPIELQAGTQLRGFDIRLQAAGVYSIRFEFPQADQAEFGNSPPAGFLLNGQGFVGRGAMRSSKGLVFEEVPPGSYDVVVIQGSEVGKPRYARQPVDVVSADVDLGTMNFLPAVDFFGSVRVEGGVLRDLDKLSIQLQSGHPIPLMGPSSGEVKQDGSFLLKDVAPGVYEVSINGAREAYLKSMRLGGKQLTDRKVDLASESSGPFVVVLGADAGQIEGSVGNAKGGPTVRARVNAIAYGDHLGRTDLHRFAFTDDKGEFSIHNVAPGDYKIFAWEDVPVGAPQDPDFRKPFEKRAVTVRMPPNGHEKVQVTAIAAAETKTDDQ
jgi:hypothetical protein